MDNRYRQVDHTRGHYSKSGLAQSTASETQQVFAFATGLEILSFFRCLQFFYQKVFSVNFFYASSFKRLFKQFS